jgi:hypothetical protein
MDDAPLSKDELMKKKAVFIVIISLVALACASIAQLGKIA